MINKIRYWFYKKKKALLFPLRGRFSWIINILDDPRRIKILCQHCNRLIPAMCYHGGFSDLLAFYCSKCSATLSIHCWEDDHGKLPDTRNLITQEYGKEQIPLWTEFESTLPKCRCGGAFRYLNPPRCPKCEHPILGDIYEGKPVLKARDYQILDFGKMWKPKELKKD